MAIPITQVTLGLTPTFTRSQGVLDALDFDRASPCVMEFSIEGLSSASAGLLIEIGGSGVGMYAGMRSDGRFVARAGDGMTPWPANTGYTLSAPNEVQGDGVLTLEFIPGTPVSARAWWNGRQVSGAVSSGVAADWGGTNDGAFGVTSSTAIPAGEAATVATFTSISDLTYFENQTVADASSPAMQVKDEVVSNVCISITSNVARRS